MGETTRDVWVASTFLRPSFTFKWAKKFPPPTLFLFNREKKFKKKKNAKKMQKMQKKKQWKKINVSICHKHAWSITRGTKLILWNRKWPPWPALSSRMKEERLKLCYNCLQDSDYLMRVAITLNSSMLLSWSLRATYFKFFPHHTLTHIFIYQKKVI